MSLGDAEQLAGVGESAGQVGTVAAAENQGMSQSDAIEQVNAQETPDNSGETPTDSSGDSGGGETPTDGGGDSGGVETPSDGGGDSGGDGGGDSGDVDYNNFGGADWLQEDDSGGDGGGDYSSADYSTADYSSGDGEGYGSDD